MRKAGIGQTIHEEHLPEDQDARLTCGPTRSELPLYLSDVFKMFVERSPITVIARIAMERALSGAAADAVFERVADAQYTRELAFSTIIDLMGAVVTRVRPSIHAAIQATRTDIPVSVTSIYNKLNGVEPKVCAALVAHGAGRLTPVIESMGGQLSPWLPGYRVRILDGNHLGATERRLDVLKRSAAGPLPGQCLVMLCPSLKLITDVIPCEDGHAQERSMTDSILALVEVMDVILGDRNFCTSRILGGIAARRAFFMIRQHAANVAWEPVGKRVKVGGTETGVVFEQAVRLDVEGGPLEARRITLELDKPTRDKQTELHILTNLPAGVAPATRIVEMYRGRWTLETAFQELTVYLRCEVNTLGYPRAALLGFCVALIAYNVMSTVKATLRAVHGEETVEKNVSAFYLANEVSVTHQGMMVVLPPEQWVHYNEVSARKLGNQMVGIARNVNMGAFQKHPRGPKKPVPPRNRFTDHSHVSTARLLADKKARRKRP